MFLPDSFGAHGRNISSPLITHLPYFHRLFLPAAFCLSVCLRTKVIQNTPSPTWDEVFDFAVKEPSRRLHIEVYDADSINDSFQGQFDIQLEELMHRKRVRNEPGTREWAAGGGMDGGWDNGCIGDWVQLITDHTVGWCSGDNTRRNQCTDRAITRKLLRV